MNINIDRRRTQAKHRLVEMKHKAPEQPKPNDKRRAGECVHMQTGGCWPEWMPPLAFVVILWFLFGNRPPRGWKQEKLEFLYLHVKRNHTEDGWGEQWTLARCARTAMHRIGIVDVWLWCVAALCIYERVETAREREGGRERESERSENDHTIEKRWTGST